MHQTISKHDAIGNDIFFFFYYLKKKHDVYIYCENLLNDNLKSINRKELNFLLKEPKNLLIYHHSIFWIDGEKILDTAKCKIWIKYHNVTPPFFFKDYTEKYYYLCKEGRKQTKRLLDKYSENLWISDSEYNFKELNIKLKENHTILSPFNNIEKFKDVVPDKVVLNMLLNKNNKVKLLFVGRVAPNKGHIKLIETIEKYKKIYDENILLYVVGAFDDELTRYNYLLKKQITDLKLEQNIFFVNKINDENLLSFYLGCDYFLCLSEHEGFCVPVVEAQSLCLPVISSNSSALPETLGSDQIIFKNDEILSFISSINILENNFEYRKFIVDKGYNNYNLRFKNEVVKEKLFNFVNNEKG